MSVTAAYWRYGQIYEAEFESINQAFDFLEYGEDTGSLSSEAVRVDGKVVLEGRALVAAASERLRELEADNGK